MRKGILLLACLALVSCKHARNAEVTAENGAAGTPGVAGINGVNGTNGKDGLSGPILTVYNIPTRGKCINLGSGIWAENEGNHTDIYNNSDCNHSGSRGEKAFCNDLADRENGSPDNEVCWVGNRQFTVQGQNAELCIHELTFPKPLDFRRYL